MNKLDQDKKVEELSIENMDIITEVDDKAGAAANDDQNEWFEFWTLTSAHNIK
ncbi:hypothetical protein NBRC116583_06030 [Arenicella sp. 4NH20-0111]|uniref:hypothetical protein n=1 Tax=Arenicella sp. 4NH20-0111 TaxID=3127648 RepID=UPI00310C5331